MQSEVRLAFLAIRAGWPPDRVVADPLLNESFIAECRKAGLASPACALNQCLLNLRKGSQLKGLPRSKKTTFKEEEEYRFASEIAARHLERQEGASLDAIICDPSLVVKFDQLAAHLAPGFTPFQYRWAALNLRKGSNLKPELLSRVVPSETTSLGPVSDLDLASVSTKQGMYIFYDPKSKTTLYVGEALNLRVRLEKHLDLRDLRPIRAFAPLVNYAAALP